MTTRIHILNLGPDRVVVKATNSAEQELYPGDSVNEYVYDSQQVTVKENPIQQKSS
jgi:hypothetical protein